MQLILRQNSYYSPWYLWVWITVLSLPHLSFQEVELGTNRTGKDFALFFAVNQYDDSGWQDLRNPVRDAQAIAKELEEMYGFQTQLYENLNRKQVLNTLRQWQTRRFSPDGQLLVFFTGHGTFSNVTSKGFFVPSDGQYEDEYNDTHIELTTIGNMVNNIRCNHILLAIDACYSGTIDRKIAFKGEKEKRFQRMGEGVQNERDNLIARQLRNNSRFLLTSGGKERTPDGQDHSPFAGGFLKALRKAYTQGEGLLTFLDLLGALDGINPTPHEGILPGHKDGGFVFVSDHIPGSKDVTGIQQEIAAWNRAKSQHTVAAYETYLRAYPKGNFVDAARARIKTLQANDIPSDMVLIRGGTFQMGDTFGEGESDETPTHSVTVDDFYLNRFEVSVKQFKMFVEATGYRTVAETQGSGRVWASNRENWGYVDGVNWRHDYKGDILPNSQFDHPVIHVSWYDAIEYCNWRSREERLQPVYTLYKSLKDSNNQNASDELKWIVQCNWQANGYRLPTEVEWEYAAREKGRKVRFGNGKSIADSKEINFNGEEVYKRSYSVVGIYRSNTVSVNRFSPNSQGLYNLSGNVWEWCWDWYDSNYYIQTQELRNPRGSGSGSYRVVRGGSWDSYPGNCRASNRGRGNPYGCRASDGYKIPPYNRDNGVGFRVSRRAR